MAYFIHKKEAKIISKENNNATKLFLPSNDEIKDALVKIMLIKNIFKISLKEKFCLNNGNNVLKNI